MRSILLVVASLLLGCQATAQSEASASLDAKDLPAVLSAMVPLMDSGYSEAQSAELQRLAASMKVDEDKERTFAIVYKGKAARLRVVLHCDDVDAYEVWFYTVPELANRMQEEIKRVMQRLGR